LGSTESLILRSSTASYKLPGAHVAETKIFFLSYNLRHEKDHEVLYPCFIPLLLASVAPAQTASSSPSLTRPRSEECAISGIVVNWREVSR